MLKKILIIEDDKEINKLLCDILESGGYGVSSAFTGLEGISRIKDHKYDMVLLDLMLPFKSGDEVLRELRTFSKIPAIIISAKDLTRTKVDLLRLGADDYITKPFDIDEVLARIEACFRRYTVKDDTSLTDKILKYSNITLNIETKEAIVNEQALTLTSKEYKILELLLKYPQKVFSKANLFESVWDEAYLGDDNTLNVHMSNLRGKLKAADPDTEYIETLWGMGYRLYTKS